MVSTKLTDIKKINRPNCKAHKCPQCKSCKTWKDGNRYHLNKKIQRYLCRDCGYRFSESNVEFNIAVQDSKLLHSSSDLTEQVISSRKPIIKKCLDSSLLLSSKNVGSQSSKPQYITTVGKGLNSFLHCNSDDQVGVNEKRTKNLDKSENKQTQAAGVT